jgi:hypothetical protein
MPDLAARSTAAGSPVRRRDSAAMLPFAILLAMPSWRRRAEVEDLPSLPASPKTPSIEEIEPALARA